MTCQKKLLKTVKDIKTYKQKKSSGNLQNFFVEPCTVQND